ncbi:hypothetical protein TNCV_988671 [Trichonephila clavipes]|nr:hypothetical protein TNCV_988671 [Trichonephila clavipes]
MERSTNTELMDMHLINGLAEGNSKSTERLYHKIYKQRNAPDPLMFKNLDHNFYEYGSLRGPRRKFDSFPEDTSMLCSGFKPKPIRLQAECHNYHSRCGGKPGLYGNTPTEIKEKLDSVYGESAPSFTIVKVWAAEFKHGRKSLGADERSGATTDENIHRRPPN